MSKKNRCQILSTHMTDRLIVISRPHIKLAFLNDLIQCFLFLPENTVTNREQSWPLSLKNVGRCCCPGTWHEIYRHSHLMIEHFCLATDSRAQTISAFVTSVFETNESKVLDTEGTGKEKTEASFALIALLLTVPLAAALDKVLFDEGTIKFQMQETDS